MKESVPGIAESVAKSANETGFSRARSPANGAVAQTNAETRQDRREARQTSSPREPAGARNLYRMGGSAPPKAGWTISYTPRTVRHGAGCRSWSCSDGCTQTAADFAAGTGMNKLADELAFLALYPQQAASANLGRCVELAPPRATKSGVAANRRRSRPLRGTLSATCKANSARVYIAGISGEGGCRCAYRVGISLSSMSRLTSPLDLCVETSAPCAGR